MGDPAIGRDASARVAQVLEESLRVKRELLASSVDEIATAGRMVAGALLGGARVLLFGNGGSA